MPENRQLDEPKQLDDLLDEGMTLMVGTGADLSFRPLTVARVRASRIEILVDSREEWAVSHRPADRVHATLSDTRKNTWAELHGTAVLTTDSALIDELWNPFASAYFDDGRETPGIAVFAIDVSEGRYWSAPSGRIGTIISVVAAAVGNGDSGGKHGDVAV